jgi:[ribosomal protein S5]-alanine N-acetyltransferase
METMPYRPELDRSTSLGTGHAVTTMTTVQAVDARSEQATVTTNWREQLPVLSGVKLTLRELVVTDAPSLLALLTSEEVSRFISPPPTGIEGFERFISWTHRERAAGRYVCFAVVPQGGTTAVGLFQIRQLEQGFASAEWGFAIGSAHWGTGIFAEGARMAVDFAIETIGVRRLEARAAVANGRGNGALRKIGAVQEGVLRRSFVKDGRHLDQVLWSILAEEWCAKAVWGPVPIN